MTKTEHAVYFSCHECVLNAATRLVY